MAILKLQPVTVCTVERQNPANLEAGGAACAPALTLRFFPFLPGPSSATAPPLRVTTGARRSEPCSAPAPGRLSCAGRAMSIALLGADQIGHMFAQRAFI